LAVGAAHASGASAYVYWANGGGGLGGTIGRANLDGTGAGSLIGASKPAGVAVDGTHVYWADNAYSTIGRANLDGTGARFIIGASKPTGVAVDGTHVYWANGGFGSDNGGFGSGTTIGRANLDGTGANQSFITGVENPTGVAVDGTHVYWAGTRGIGRANLDGTGANQSFISYVYANYAWGVAVDGTHVYWADRYSRTIGRANLNGTGVNHSFITANRPTGVAVDGTHVYWANGGGGSGTTIGRANLNGTGANQSFITGVFDPWGVAVDALLPPAPVISSASLSSPAFRAAARGASLTALSKTGTDIRYRDSQAATTTFSVLRGTVGHKTGRLCVARAPRKNQKPCTRFVSAGSFTHKDQAGNIKVHFTGRVGGKKLALGPYKLTLTPKFGGKTGRTVSLAFRIST
jgi:virginiamycin B lyase